MKMIKRVNSACVNSNSLGSRCWSRSWSTSRTTGPSGPRIILEWWGDRSMDWASGVFLNLWQSESWTHLWHRSISSSLNSELRLDGEDETGRFPPGWSANGSMSSL